MKKLSLIIIALIAFAQGAWAQSKIYFPEIPTEYVECSWSGDNTTGHVVQTTKSKGITEEKWLGVTTTTLSGWCYLRESKTYDDTRLVVTSDCYLILADGKTMTCEKGIQIKEGCTLTVYAQSGGTGKIVCSGGNGDNAALGGNKDEVGGYLVIHGGTITASASSNNAAGIGGGNHGSGLQGVTIYAGTVTATGKSSGAGIGAGQQNNTLPTVKIYGGTVTATGGSGGAGIGGGEDRGGGKVYIYGGTVTAQGGSNAAGIGGGVGGSNDCCTIYGGTVTATGGNNGAGIGGGKYSSGGGAGGTVNIYGGTVTATAGEDGSGIGGGKKGAGANVYIYGGTVTAKNVENGWAIGGGYSCSQNGSVTLGSDIQVRTGGTTGSLVNKDNRVSTLMSGGERTAMVCSHEGGLTYTSKDDYYHHANCQYCEGYDEQHTKGDNDKCTKCSHPLPEHSYTFYEINEAGDGYASEGTAYYVTATHEFTFPDCSNVRKPLYFAGWLQANSAPESLITDGDGDLIQAGETIEVPMETSDRNYYARYTEHAFSGGEGTQSDPFLISTTADWTELATAVGDGYNFNGLYLQLTNDISVTTMVGQGDNRFRGIFDGQGHTITVDYTGENAVTEEYAAPFRNISGATIKNLNTTGTIETSNRFAGGIVGYTRYYSTIENCHSDVTIRSSYPGEGGHGGILGLKANVTQSEPTVEGCVFEGKILTVETTEEAKTTGCGGIVGWTNGQSLTVENCLYKPAALETGETAVACSTIFGEHGGAITCTDCFYTEAPGTIQGTQAYTVQSGTEGLTLNYNGTATTYGYDGIEAYSFDQGSEETATGLLYGGKLYANGTMKVIFTPEADQIITVVLANETLLSGNGDGTYTVTMSNANVTITAVINPYTITLYDGTHDPTNAETINENYGNIADVTIDGRTLYKGSTWNTLCLPFDVSAAQIAISDHPLYGATIKELDTDGWYDSEGIRHDAYAEGYKQTGFDGATGTLRLYFQTVTAIKASKPYIVKWASGEDITSPLFPFSEIDDSEPEFVECNDNRVNFGGNYDPISSEDHVLYDENNTNNHSFHASIFSHVEHWYTDADCNTSASTIPFNTSTGQVTLYSKTLSRTVTAGSDWDNVSDGWAFIASPVVDEISPRDVVGLIADTVSQYDLYRLNPSDTKWENYKAHEDFCLENGMGYLYATKYATNLVFTGTFNTKDADTIPLSQGFNLVGNPFTVSATINKSYYTLNSDGSAVQTATSSDPIPPCHGVIVQATSANDSVVFTKATQQSAGPSNSGLRIALTQANTRSNALLDNAIITFNEGSQLGKFYFGKQNANIYIPQGGEEYAIVSVGNGRDAARNVSTNEVPLNFKAKENGTYKISVNPEGAEMAYLHLIDNMTGADVDLLPPLRGGQGESKQASYTFQAKTTDYASRFKLVFSICGDANGDNETFAFISNGNIIINGEGTLQVVDMTGRVIRCTDGVHTVSTNGMPAGVYVLRLINGENSKTQKIVIQ